MQLSKLENQAYEKLKKENFVVFKAKDIQMLLKISRLKTYNLLKALKKKKAIMATGKRSFCMNDANEFITSTRINYPSYISFWSALNYYGFSDNMPKKIFLATTKYSKEINRFKYITISKKKFFGYVSINGIIIAEKEKAFIDCLMFPKYSGGIKEIKNSLENSKKSINARKLINYALKINHKGAIRRLGFLLEKIGLKEGLDKLKKNIGKGFMLLDPSMQKKNNLNKSWLLDINNDID